MLSELHRLADGGVTNDEMKRASGQLSGASALALEDSDTRMSRLGRSEITLGEFADLDEVLRRLALVTAADVQGLAAELVSGAVSISAVGALDDDAFAAIIPS
jgi:predicted Zn-dependent peptidase